MLAVAGERSTTSPGAAQETAFSTASGKVPQAVNGTLRPANDLMGIPEAIFAGTLTHWRPEVTAAKFWRRMAPGGNSAPSRPDESLYAELRYFDAAFRKNLPFTIRYDLAVIGIRDRIFPPGNQAAAWNESGTAVRQLDLPHDPGIKMTELIDLEP